MFLKQFDFHECCQTPVHVLIFVVLIGGDQRGALGKSRRQEMRSALLSRSLRGETERFDFVNGRYHSEEGGS